MIQCEQIEAMKTREDFIGFITSMSKRFTEAPGEWTNKDLASFLEAMAAWTADMDGYYTSRGETPPEQPSWKTLADIMMAATMYE